MSGLPIGALGACICACICVDEQAARDGRLGVAADVGGLGPGPGRAVAGRFDSDLAVAAPILRVS